MPIYEYECQNCKHVTEVIQAIDDLPPSCNCTGEETVMEKLMSIGNFILKGSGWYITDYKDKK